MTLRHFVCCSVLLALGLCCQPKSGSGEEGKKEEVPSAPGQTGGSGVVSLEDGQRMAAGLPPAMSDEEKEALELLSEASPRHLGAMLFWPSKWRVTVEYLSPLLGGFHLPQPLEEAIRNSSSPKEILALMIGQLKPPLEHWDLQRPVLFAFFETDPMFGSAVDVVQVALGTRAGVGQGIRSRLILPATDVAALVAEFADLFQMMGLEAFETRRLIPSAPEKAALFGSGGFAVLVIPETGRVRLEMFSGWLGSQDIPPAPAPDMAMLLNKEGSTFSLTPAVRHAVASGRVLTLFVRTGLLRDMGTMMSLLAVRGALSAAAPEYKARLTARGLAEVLTGYLLTSPGLSAHGDVSWALEVRDGLRLLVVGEVTSQGKKLYEKGGLVTSTKSFGKAVGWVLKGELNMDLGAMLGAGDRTPLFPAEVGRRDARHPFEEVGDAIQECGFACLAHVALGGWPIVVDRLLQSTFIGNGDEPAWPLPKAPAAVVFDSGPDGGIGRLAASALFKAGTPPNAVKAVFSQLTQWRLPKADIQAEVGDPGVTGLFAFGLGTDVAFGKPEKPVVDAPHLQFGFRPYLWVQMRPGLTKEWVALGGTIEDIVGTARYKGDFVAAEIRLRTRSADGKPLPEVPVLAEFPAGGEPVNTKATTYTDADRCLDKSIAIARMLLMRVSDADPELLAKVTADGIGELAQAALCAGDDAALKGKLEKLQKLLTDFTAKVPTSKAD